MSRGFRLASLLRVRRIQEDEAAARLANAHRASSEAQERSARAAARLAGASLDASLPVGVWQALTATRAAMRRGLEDADALVATRQGAVADAEKAWREARGRVRTFERLEEQHDARTAAAELADEQRALDEAGRRRPAGRPEETTE